MKARHHFDSRRTTPALTLLILLGIAAGRAPAQSQNPTSAPNPFWGSVTAQPVTGEPLKLSLDDAVQRGLKNNLGLNEVENEEKTYHAEKNEALQLFLADDLAGWRHRLPHARSGGAGLRAEDDLEIYVAVSRRKTARGLR